jgi:flotillin
MSNPALIALTEESMLWLVAAVVAAGIILFSFVVLLTSRYKRCPSNKILVVYGKTGGSGSSKCIHGGAAFIVPLLQDYAFLSTTPMQIETPLKGALSLENIRVNVPSVFTVAIGRTPELMQNAAARLLNLSSEEISGLARDIIFGQLRQVIASMKIEDINRDRDKFLQNIQDSLEPELRKIGLELINVNITDITDDSGYIEAIGRKAASQAVQQAKIDVAEQEKHGEIGVAEAERVKSIQVANANKLREIGTREAVRDQTIRLAELAKEQKVGESRAAFERDAQVAEAEREKRVRLAEANAKAVAGEAAAQAEIAVAQANLQVRNAEAYQLGETRKREAEAAVLEAQNRAMARAALAEAERIEAEKRAALEAPAKAEKARTIVQAEAEAEKAKIAAQAEAQANFARLEAEARGQYEILAKKGEGLQRIIEACGGAQQAFQLLMLEHLDTLAQTAATAISNIKFDKVIVWDGANGASTTNFLQSFARTLPPMMQVLRDIGGVEVPEYLAKMSDAGANQAEQHAANGRTEAVPRA